MLLAKSLRRWRSSMASTLKIFAPRRHPVLSFNVQAQASVGPRQQSQFEVLVRHLLGRFFNNELLASDDETKRVMMIAYTVALPGLFVALLLFPAYHAFPPAPLHRSFWSQIGDHYFYVMYAFVIMGMSTVYEWDLLFPDFLDVFILSVLPMTPRRLFSGRVLALVIFLSLVLVGTSLFGMAMLPLIAGLPDFGHHLLAHAVAVLMSGAFAASTFLALQGILINVVGERLFRRSAPLLQGISLMTLLAILFLDPLISRSIEALLTSDSAAVLWFPPFWYLGIYERILSGSAALPIFAKLATTGIYALALMFGCTLLTYPLAYRRRVRQVIEGGGVTAPPTRTSANLARLLHRTILRLPATLAVFHFIGQTVVRSQRHRVMLALYAGLAIALATANMIVLKITSGHVRIVLTPDGIRAAGPIIAFWTAAGLTSLINAPVDRRGAWLFRVLLGRPRAIHYEAVRIWITLWSGVAGIVTVLLLSSLLPADLHTWNSLVALLLVAASISLLVPDLFLFMVRAFPFTTVHKSAITDFPLMLLRYVILFPLMILVIMHYEPAIEVSWIRLLATLLVVIGVHQLIAHLYKQSMDPADSVLSDDADEYPQRLGL